MSKQTELDKPIQPGKDFDLEENEQDCEEDWMFKTFDPFAGGKKGAKQ